MNGVSFYKEKLTDGKAVYFTQDNFNIKNDGTEDVSVQLQEAIHAVVKQDVYGVLFVPEGKYLLSRTIYVPKACKKRKTPIQIDHRYYRTDQNKSFCNHLNGILNHS